MNNYRPLVSILTPVYNNSAFIEQTIESVLKQTFQDWEWIILDDGSTDGTGEIIRKTRDSRIHYSLQEHAGIDHITRTYNRALAMCRGDFVALLDSDDYWPEYKLETQIKGFDDPDIILSYGECMIVDKEGKELRYMGLPGDLNVAYNRPRGSALKILLTDMNCFLYLPTIMLRKSVLLTIGGFVEAKGMWQDYPTWLVLSLLGNFSAIPVCLGYYRKHSASITATKDQEDHLNAKIHFLRDFVFKNGPMLKEVGFSVDMDKLERHWGALKKDRFLQGRNKINKKLETIRSDRLFKDLGYSGAMDILERHSEKIKGIIMHRAYSRAMLLLKDGLFEEARFEFQRFLAKDSSLKSRIIYFLIIVTTLLRNDLVHPLIRVKSRLQELLRKIVK